MKPPFELQHRRKRAGFTLVENLIAAAVLLTFLSSLFVLSGRCIQILRMSSNHAAASQVLQQRNEQMRVASWKQINDPVWVSSNILNQDVAGEDALRDPQELVTIAPYSTGSNTVVVNGINTFTRSNGVVTTSGSNDLSANSAVQVTWRVTWTEVATNRSISRENTTVLANGGTPK